MRADVIISFGLLLSFPMINADESNCIFGQFLENGRTYYVYNPQYPNNYAGENNCQWKSESAFPTTVNCTINIPANVDGCTKDYIEVRFAGGKEGKKYCGKGTFSHEGLNATIIFHSTFDTKGGSFMCQLKAEKKFDPYNCVCGWKNEGKNTRIVGGSETGVNEYPLMVGLYDALSGMITCGASLISSKHVLTAAHCVYKRNFNNIHVIVGEHDVRTGGETNATRAYRVYNCETHPNYDENYYDIAICEVYNEIQFSKEVGPVCLPFQHSCDSFGGQIVTALGWGLTDFGGYKATKLQQVKLNVINMMECKKIYSDVTSNNLCTYTPGKDTCQMDSGGPVLWQNPTTHRLVLIGVTTAGYGCAMENPAIEERVGAYLDWIQSVTKMEYCKME